MQDQAVHTICVCGAGTMGAGIAQLAAQSGFHTILFDVDSPRLEKAAEEIGARLGNLAEKKIISHSQCREIMGRLEYTADIRRCVGDLVIEAILESLPAKKALFQQLAEINHADVVFASNTSSLSVTAIAASVPRPGRVAGMHFFNPAPVMKLVEIVQAGQTGPESISLLRAVATRMGKTAVVCRDSPGFIVNRVARPYYLEALRLLEAGVADITAIDALMESAGFRMGPFRLMDLIGNDINLAVSQSLYESLGKPERLRPSGLQQEMVTRGELGKKTGRGYYSYN
jgi:3-hydroxybutyryl-CoA dehydrogenase